MATIKFSQLIKVCEALKMDCKRTKRCLIYEGNVNGDNRKVVIHLHAQGRDIATGTFHRYVKDLGFNSEDELRKYLENI